MPRGRYHQRKVPGANIQPHVPENAGQDTIRQQPAARPAVEKTATAAPKQLEPAKQASKPQRTRVNVVGRLQFKRLADKFSSPPGSFGTAEAEIKKLGIDGLRAQREEIAKNVISIALGELSPGDAMQVKMQLVSRRQRDVAEAITKAVGFIRSIEGRRSSMSLNTGSIFQEIETKLSGTTNPLQRHALLVARERIIRHLESRLLKD
ncbi:MAG: hypothetical protein NT067_07475 [Candidatus Diapherotrites archaeon]|nr:hypothetical protein [Candidatus Diapherotrites archaeon]